MIWVGDFKDELKICDVFEGVGLYIVIIGSGGVVMVVVLKVVE